MNSNWPFGCLKSLGWWTEPQEEQIPLRLKGCTFKTLSPLSPPLSSLQNCSRATCSPDRVLPLHRQDMPCSNQEGLCPLIFLNLSGFSLSHLVCLWDSLESTSVNLEGSACTSQEQKERKESRLLSLNTIAVWIPVLLRGGDHPVHGRMFRASLASTH